MTARAADDANATDESVTLTATASEYQSNEDVDLSATVTATVDDDEARGIPLSASTLSVPEEGNAAYDMHLSSEPVGGRVTVAITGAGSGLSVDTTGDQTALTFTTANWNTDQTVTVRTANDLNGVNARVMLTHTPTGADYNGVTVASLTATDDEAPGLAVSVATAGLTVRENASGT